MDKWWCENMLFGEWDIKKIGFNLFSINYYPVPETVEKICREFIKDSFWPPEQKGQRALILEEVGMIYFWIKK